MTILDDAPTLAPSLTPGAPHVWVGCLGCYNAGYLVGDWVDATEADTVTVTTLLREMDSDAVLEEHLGTWHPAASPHEELWVMDFENFGEALDGECSPSHAQAVALLLARVEEEAYAPEGAFAAWMSLTGRSWTEDADGLIEDFGEAFAGEWPSAEHYVEEFIEDVYGDVLAGLPDFLRHRIDWEGVARDFDCGGDISEAEAPGGVFIFRNV